jgi:predicted outer membrane repeat protein
MCGRFYPILRTILSCIEKSIYLTLPASNHFFIKHIIMKKVILLFTLVFMVGMPTFSTRYLIQSGAPDAATWRTASSNETLVDLSAIGKTLNQWLPTSFPSGDEIWLAAGTYTVNDIYNIPANFTLYGGFDGTETDISQRAEGANPWDFINETVIDGNSATAIFGCNGNRVALYNGLTLKNGKISGNSGALMTRDGIVVRNCKFTDNEATGQGGAILMNGGGEIYDSYFYNNQSNQGGAIAIGNTAVSVIISGCLLEENVAAGESNSQGGAIRSQAVSATISDCIIRNNTAATNGSAIYTQTATKGANKIINCLIYGNKTKSALYIYGATLYNCTVVENEAGAAYFANQYGQIYNSVFWGSTSANASISIASNTPSGGAELKNNAVMSEPTHTYLAKEGNIIFNSNILPYFADPAGNDWSITHQSVLLNAADATVDTIPAADILGLARPQGNGYDIGAYELPYYNVNVRFGAGGEVSGFVNNQDSLVAKGTQLSFTITPQADYQIKSVRYNNVDVKDDLQAGTYTSPALDGNATLDVEFEGLATSLENNPAAGFSYQLRNGQLELNKLPVGATLQVYAASGILVAGGAVSQPTVSITLAKGLYIIRMNDTIRKIFVNL